MTIAKEKTETVAFNYDETIRTKASLFEIDGIPIKNVQEFKYLGYKVSNNEKESDTIDVNYRIALAESKFQEMKRLLCDREISIKLRAKTFLQAYVRSRMCYSVQAWPPKESETKILESKWNGFLRRMVNGGYLRKENSMAYRYSNIDLQQITGTSCIRKYIRDQQLKYLAHVCRMNNNDVRNEMLFSQDKKHAVSTWSSLERALKMGKSQKLI